MFSRENRKLVLVAAACIAVSLAAPAAAREAKKAINAQSVDGFHAVKYSAPAGVREGRLVATNPTTGELPNNIIAEAPDAARLAGTTPTQLRFLSIDTFGSAVSHGATIEMAGPPTGGIDVPTDGAFADSFVVPPDYRAGDAIRLTVDVTSDTASCVVKLIPNFAETGRPGHPFSQSPSDDVDGGFSGPASVTMPATAETIQPIVYTIVSPAAGEPIVAGEVVGYGLFRDDSTCGSVTVSGMSVTY